MPSQWVCTRPGCALAVPPGLRVAKVSWKGGDIWVVESGPRTDDCALVQS